MTQFLDTLIDKSLGTAGAWTDIDLSSDVPVGATGAIFRIHITSGDGYFGLRKKGSTDDRYNYIFNAHQFAIIGLDSNRKCEGKIDAVDIDFYLIGYAEADATFFTNAPDKSLSAMGAWTDIDLSANIPEGAVAAIFEVGNASSNYLNWGLRKNGSTDNRHTDMYKGHKFMIVGVDANRKCEGYIEQQFIDFYLLGYLTMGQAETNAHDRSLGATGSYVDIDESGNAPAGAAGVFGEVVSTSSYAFAARKNGASFDYYDDLHYHDSIMAGLDANRKWEGKIENVAVDFYTMGYFVPGGITEKTSSDVGVGADAEAELLSSRSESDLGAGADSALGIQAAVINTDVGAGIDTILESLSTRLESEVGSGVDALIALLKAVAKYSLDTGAGVDAVSDIKAELAQNDQGTGIDALLSRRLSSSDDGVGVDVVFNQLARIVASDVGVGAGGLTALIAGIKESDSGAGVEDSTVGFMVYLLLKLLQAKEISMKLSNEKILNMKLSQKQQGG